MYEVHFHRLYSEPAEIAVFDQPHDALAHAQGCLSGPYYMLRIHDTTTAEWLTYAQLDYRLNGGLVPRA